MEADKEFTCWYPFKGAQWGFTIWATDHAEAVERLKAMAWAKVDGEIFAKDYVDAPIAIEKGPVIVGSHRETPCYSEGQPLTWENHTPSNNRLQEAGFSTPPLASRRACVISTPCITGTKIRYPWARDRSNP